jgi:glutaredoxin 3
MSTQPAIVVYSRDWCGYCTAAIDLLDARGHVYQLIDVSAWDPERRAWLSRASGQRTVPQIFVYGNPIGGYTELRALVASGEFDRMLAAGPLVT